MIRGPNQDRQSTVHSGVCSRERERVDRRNHDVITSVDDQRWLNDRLEFGETLAFHLAPFHDRSDLSLHRLRRGEWIDIFLAQVPPFPKLPAFGLAARRGSEEQIKEVIEPRIGSLHTAASLSDPGQHVVRCLQA